MAKTDKQNDTKPAETTVDQYAKDDAAFAKIPTERFMYNADKCRAIPLVGYLLNRIPMPPIERGKELKAWDAFLVRTTRTTLGINRDGEVVEIPAGEDMLIPATHQLAQFLSLGATNPDFVYEVKISPAKKVDIGKGQQMWQYEMSAKVEPQARRKFGFAAIIGSSIRELASGAEDSDTPF